MCRECWSCRKCVHKHLSIYLSNNERQYNYATIIKQIELQLNNRLSILSLTLYIFIYIFNIFVQRKSFVKQLIEHNMAVQIYLRHTVLQYRPKTLNLCPSVSRMAVFYKCVTVQAQISFLAYYSYRIILLKTQITATILDLKL